MQPPGGRPGGTYARTLAPPARALAALWQQRRPRRQDTGARSGSPSLIFALGYAIIATRLVMFAAAPESASGAARHRTGRGRDRATRHPRPQRRNPGDRRAHAIAVRRAAPHHRRGRGIRAAHRGDAGSRRAPSCASGSAPSAASSGSSARSRRSNASRFTGSACPGSASCRRTSASIRTAPRSRM